MSKKTDTELGMDTVITRRDLIHDAGVATLAMALGPGIVAAAPADGAAAASKPSAADYPPVRTGLRGSHPGAFESAHALAREGRSFPEPVDLDQHFDLVIVGAGISGLAAAHYYRQRFGADKRILLLENHDDFGGHARRNEFHQGGRMVLSMGGTHNLEWWNFSATVQAFLQDHGVDVELMRERKQFDYGHTAPNSPAMWFDAETYGENRLVVNCDLAERLDPATVDQMPISEAGRESFKRFYAACENVLEHLDEDQAEDYLRSISYPEFLRRHGGLAEDAIALFAKQEHGGWGVEMRALSAMEAMESGAPGAQLLGKDWDSERREYPAAMWPATRVWRGCR